MLTPCKQSNYNMPPISYSFSNFCLHFFVVERVLVTNKSLNSIMIHFSVLFYTCTKRIYIESKNFNRTESFKELYLIVRFFVSNILHVIVRIFTAQFQIHSSFTSKLCSNILMFLVLHPNSFQIYSCFWCYA